MGRYGWKIRNYKAATVYGKNIGIRDRYDYTEAILHHSLFTRFLKKYGMKTDKKDESTRDIICIEFGFGLRSYEDELKHLDSMRDTARKKIKNKKELEKRLEFIDNIEKNIHEKKHLFKKISKDEIRKEFYVNGVDIQYLNETIHYKMLYRNPSKAKQGSCMFIREELYDIGYNWLTMGLVLPKENAKIVEISAYSPLTTSALDVNNTSLIEIPVDEILVLKDVDSYFRTISDVIRTEDVGNKKKCIVSRELTDVKNTLWDGMGLIDSLIFPSSCNGMILLRNHFFKACCFKTHITKFFKDYCSSNSLDFDTFVVYDMYNYPHLAKNIKLITTDNALKIKKFSNLVGNKESDIFDYWKERIKSDGCIFGIVKTDHPSKLGNVQQMSYQMINSLPTTKEGIKYIVSESVKYVELLKTDIDVFIDYLRKNSTAINHYNMLADLYEHNHEFANSKMFKNDRAEIINKYVNKLRKGKLIVEGDNLTVCGNPYGLLLHSVREDPETDPTFKQEDGVIQVHTKKFKDGEYLCGIRSPQNGQSNLGYFKNVRHDLFDKYFDFSNNILAVNCIHTDVQARMNGEDFDSDFNFVTNQREIVEASRIAYRDFPTVVNEVEESTITYNNTKEDYAIMDSKMQSNQRAIGGSSDTAQLALSYYSDRIYKGIYDEDTKQIYENIIILAVIAQIAIDNCKRLYAVDPTDEIKRIRKQKCMKRDKDYPRFMEYAHPVSLTKNGIARDYDDIIRDKEKLKNRIDDSIVCPMNWVEEFLDKIQIAPYQKSIPTEEFFIWKSGNANSRHIGKIRKLVSEYSEWILNNSGLLSEGNNEAYENYFLKSEEVIEKIKGVHISKITMNHLIGICIGADKGIQDKTLYKKFSKYSRILLNLLYNSDKETFISFWKI